MARKKSIDGNKWIKFRVNKKLYDFIVDVSNESNITISEMCRNAVIYFFMGHLLGEFKKPFPDLKAEFLKKFK